MICLSTDKAVYPINAMGMSKALMEKVVVSNSRNLKESETLLCATRYGNVMASRGSVIPLFVQQIKAGKDLTVTDPAMTRFMMSLDDAVDLVLYAFQNGKQGDIFVQKSPASSLEVLANALIKIFNSSSKIRVIGTRHGEKLFETLVNREEMTKAIDLGDYFRIPADTRDLNYNKYFSEGSQKINLLNEYNSHNTTQLSLEQTVKLLMKLDFIKNELSK